jgi:DnaJ-class molecular chaperone
MAESYVIRQLRRMGMTAFAKDDEFARQHGWQISLGRLGLSRTYRHPGFDELASCLACDGTGLADETTCVPCSGTGRVNRREVPSNGGH